LDRSMLIGRRRQRRWQFAKVTQIDALLRYPFGVTKLMNPLIFR
jgi:hypothetical protein